MAILVLFILFLLSFLLLLRLRSPRRLPPGPCGIPLLGALPLVGPMAHSSLASLATIYGPIMHLKMGTSSVVVASSPSAAKAFLKTLDHQFANRPDIISGKHITYDRQNFVFSDYGPRWKLTRKLLNVHMLGPKAMAEWASVRADEVRRMVGSVLELSRNDGTVMLLEMMICCNANIIGRAVMSRRVFEASGEGSVEFKNTIMELLTGKAMFNIGDFVPSIAWMDLQGVQRRIYEGHKKLDE